MQVGYIKSPITTRVQKISLVPETYEDEVILGHLLHSLRTGKPITLANDFEFELAPDPAIRDIDCGDCQ